GEVDGRLATPAEVGGLALGPDGKKLAVAGGDNRARLYTVEGALEEHLAHDGPVNAVVFAADGKRVFTAGGDKTARAWSPALAWQGRHDGAVRQAGGSPRGDRPFPAGGGGVGERGNCADGQ